MEKSIKLLVDRLYSGEVATAEQIESLIKCENNEKEYLFSTADRLQKDIYKNVVNIRAIIEFSNYCRCNCTYCGLFAKNPNITRFRMTPNEISETAIEVSNAGYETVVLQSGEDLWYTKEIIGDIITQIKANTNLFITLSVGERSYEEYAHWRNLGADRFLIKHEISSEEIYNQYHPHSSLKNRIECQNNIRDLGYELGSGFMTGLPKQTTSIIAEDILLLKRMKVSMAGIGPYICHEDTPLHGNPDGDADITLKAVAVARLVLHKCNLPSTSALNIKGGLKNALNCGANVIMQKATPFKYRDLYDIYPGRESKNIEFKEQFSILKQDLKELGKTAR